MIRLLNSAVMPHEGVFECRGPLRDYEAKAVFDEARGRGLRYRSYIGYPNTARVVGNLLGIDCEISRSNTELKDGDVCLCFRLPYRVHPDTKAQHLWGRRIEDYEIFVVYYRED